MAEFEAGSADCFIVSEWRWLVGFAIVKRKSTRMLLLFSSGGVVVYATLLLAIKEADITLGWLLLLFPRIE